MHLDEYKRRYSATDAAPGWEAIDARLKAVYGDQEPVHFVSNQHAALGGPDQLNGISVYSSVAGGIPHLHFVTYGFSNLFYDEDAVGQAVSGSGIEMTFRLRAPASEKKKHAWVIAVLQNIARYVFKSGNCFAEFHFMSAKGPLHQETTSDVTGLVFAVDPELGRIDTPHGAVAFLQMVGITTAEFDALLADEGESVPALLESLRVGNPMLVTDLERK
jgi:Suppressor of fused protein (SUFU)